MIIKTKEYFLLIFSQSLYFSSFCLFAGCFSIFRSLSVLFDKSFDHIFIDWSCLTSNMEMLFEDDVF